MASQKVAISVDAPTDRRSCVLAIEAAVNAICERAGVDPAAMLLIAAVHIATKDASAPVNEVIEHMAFQLGEAFIEVNDLFDISRHHH